MSLSQRLRDAAALKVGGEEKPDAALLLEAADALESVPALEVVHTEAPVLESELVEDAPEPTAATEAPEQTDEPKDAA